MKILFVTWDGPQVSYLTGLFLPIFERLGDRGVRFHVLQFTWGDPARIAASRSACLSAGIGYESVTVWRRPFLWGAFLTALFGARRVRKALRESGCTAVMPRSVLPAFACLLALRRRTVPLIFDADGLPLDERVDFVGQSPYSLPHRLLRDIEAQAVRRADVVMTRSKLASSILLARGGSGVDRAKFRVVSNGRDPRVFRQITTLERVEVRASLGVPVDAPMVVYSGSLGAQYCLDEMLRLFSLLSAANHRARFLVLSQTPELILNRLACHNIAAELVIVRSGSPSEVSHLMAAGDVGIAFRRSTFSTQADAPVKLGEYMLCGLPVIATAGVGDSDGLPREVLFPIQSLDTDELARAAEWVVRDVLPNAAVISSMSRRSALERFSLEKAVRDFDSVIGSVNAAVRVREAS